MENLVNLTRADIDNGALVHLLARAGIPNVQEYVRKFHQETEELILEDLKQLDSDEIDDYEQIVPPADIEHWIAGFRPHLQYPTHELLPEDQHQQEQLPHNVQNLIQDLRPNLYYTPLTHSTEQRPLPTDLQSWLLAIRPRLEFNQTIPHEQQPKRQRPTDPTSWMQSMAPVHLHSSTDVATTTQTDIIPTDNAPISGNLGTWLTDWSRDLLRQPPPTSLDTWLQGLVSTHLHEPIGKAASSKGRLNSYLNAAQQVLSEHGYNVSNEVTPPTSVKAKTGMFGNVKQMYFLVSFSSTRFFNCFFVVVQWKTLDKNNDRKITVEDVQIMLQEMGLGFLSRYVGETLFDMVDSNHDGELQFRDFVALMGIIKQLIGAMGSAKT